MVKKTSFLLKIDKWDSYFFKTRIARLEISGRKAYGDFSAKFADLITLARGKRIVFLVVKLKYPKPIYEKSLISLGFKRYGQSVDSIFRYPKSARKSCLGKHRVRLFKPADRPAICSIAKDAFRLSYLYKCGFSKRSEVDRYHSVWAENLCRDERTKVFVAEKDKKIVGFSALSLERDRDSARIVLIAVDKNHRGEGIGRALMEECIDWGRGKLKGIYIKTQGDNDKALTLYRKLGFKPIIYDKVFCKQILSPEAVG